MKRLFLFIPLISLFSFSFAGGEGSPEEEPAWQEHDGYSTDEYQIAHWDYLINQKYGRTDLEHMKDMSNAIQTLRNKCKSDPLLWVHLKDFAIPALRRSGLCSNTLLLHGSVGTGKTTLGFAAARYFGFKVVMISGGLIANSYKDSGANHLAMLIKGLRESGEPCILIIDELSTITDRLKNEKDSESIMNTILWQEIERIKGSDLLLILTMNDISNLPEQTQDRIKDSMFEIGNPEDHEIAKLIEYFDNKYALSLEETEIVTGQIFNHELGKWEVSEVQKKRKEILADLFNGNNLNLRDINRIFKKAFSNVKLRALKNPTLEIPSTTDEFFKQYEGTKLINPSFDDIKLAANEIIKEKRSWIGWFKRGAGNVTKYCKDHPFQVVSFAVGSGMALYFGYKNICSQDRSYALQVAGMEESKSTTLVTSQINYKNQIMGWFEHDRSLQQSMSSAKANLKLSALAQRNSSLVQACGALVSLATGNPGPMISTYLAAAGASEGLEALGEEISDKLPARKGGFYKKSIHKVDDAVDLKDLNLIATEVCKELIDRGTESPSPPQPDPSFVSRNAEAIGAVSSAIGIAALAPATPALVFGIAVYGTGKVCKALFGS